MQMVMELRRRVLQEEGRALALDGPVPSRVELRDARGRVELLWATRGDSLVLEPRRALAEGTATLFIAFDGTWTHADSGLVRTGTGAATRVRLAAGSPHVLPCWPGDPSVRWTVLVHAPAPWRPSSPMLRATRHEPRGRWRTTTLRSRATAPAHALTLELTPGR